MIYIYNFCSVGLWLPNTHPQFKREIGGFLEEILDLKYVFDKCMKLFHVY